MTDDVIRNAVFARLHKHGWITGYTWVKEIPPVEKQLPGMQVKVNWTRTGLAKMRTLHACLDELGYFAHYDQGELESLHLLILMCIAEHGPGTLPTPLSSPPADPRHPGRKPRH